MISIIIPIKNHIEIDVLLNSLQKIKKPERTEVIVADASNPRLFAIIKKYPSVRWLYYKTTKKYTISEQRNMAIAHAKGDILVFIDVDCTPTNNWLINLIKPIRKYEEKIVAGGIQSKDKSSTKWKQNSKGLSNKKYLSFAPTMNSAIKKEVFNKIGLYDETFEFGGEDTDFYWRATESGYKIRYAKDAIIFHECAKESLV